MWGCAWLLSCGRCLGMQQHVDVVRFKSCWERMALQALLVSDAVPLVAQLLSVCLGWRQTACLLLPGQQHIQIAPCCACLLCTCLLSRLSIHSFMCITSCQHMRHLLSMPGCLRCVTLVWRQLLEFACLAADVRLWCDHCTAAAVLCVPAGWRQARVCLLCN
jgi:hypothetical protein